MVQMMAILSAIGLETHYDILMVKRLALMKASIGDLLMIMCIAQYLEM